MKKQFLAAFLLFALVAWTQTSTSNPAGEAPTGKSAKTACSCCDKMAADKTNAELLSDKDSAEKAGSVKDPACCPRNKESAEGKATSCCSGKNASACIKDAKCPAADCCKGSGDQCKGTSAKGCCIGTRQCAMSHKQA